MIMMASEDVDGRIPGKVYDALEKVFTGPRIGVFGCVSIEGEDKVSIYSPSKAYLKGVKKYDAIITNVLSELGMGSEGIEYKVNAELASLLPEQLSLCEPPIADYTKTDRDRLVELCAKYSIANGDGGNVPVLHSGNIDVYREGYNLLKKDGAGSLIIHGQPGRGKSDTLSYFERRARRDGKLVVGFSVDALARFLNPHNGYTRDTPDPEYYTLACEVADVVLLDQAHGLVKRNGKEINHRHGTEMKIVDLLEEVKSRGGKVIMSVTESPNFKYEDLGKFILDDVSVDKWKNSGVPDLGSRLLRYDSEEIRSPSDNDWPRFIRKILSRNEFRDVEDYVVKSFLAAHYGEAKTPASMVKKIRKVSNRLVGNLDLESIVNIAGSRAAKKKLAEGGFDISGNSKIDSCYEENRKICSLISHYRFKKKDDSGISPVTHNTIDAMSKYLVREGSSNSHIEKLRNGTAGIPNSGEVIKILMAKRMRQKKLF